MKEEIKNPSVFSTWWEVWLFKHNHQHHIPSKHHNNLANFRGCSKKTLLHYFRCGHKLNPAALQVLLQTCDEDFLQFIPSNAITAAFVQRFGVKTLLKKGLQIPSEHIRQLFRSGKTDIIQQHIKQIHFEEKDKLLLLQKNNRALTIAFLKTAPALSDEAALLLLAYDDDVLEVYLTCCKHSSSVRKEIIKNKSAKLFRVMLENSADADYTFAELKLLVKGGNLEKFSLYIDNGIICDSDDAIAFIISDASDEMFEYCIKNANFSLLSAHNCDRLFEPKFRPLLLENIFEHASCSTDTEIKLLKSNDDELIDAYLKRKETSFYQETIVWLWANNLQHKYNISAEDIPSRNWQIETQIFASGNAELIEKYLFAGEAYDDGLTEFGEAQLILHAPLNILDAYMEDNSLRYLAEKAMIARGDSALFSLFFDKHNYSLCDENMVIFLAKADTETALKYLREMENPDNFLCDYPEVLIKLCERKDKAVFEYILEQGFTLSEEEGTAFIENAPVEQIHLLLEQHSELDEQTEAALLRHPDKELVKFYLENNELYSENECILLERLDPDLVKAYDFDNFSDCAATDCML